MAKRKTINIEALKESHYRMTKGSLENPRFAGEAGKGFRDGINIMLESALHDTGNYRGFGYILDYKIDDSARNYY